MSRVLSVLFIVPVKTRGVVGMWTNVGEVGSRRNFVLFSAASLFVVEFILCRPWEVKKKFAKCSVPVALCS